MAGGGALRNLMVRINADMSGMKKELAKSQSALDSFAKGVKGTVAGIGVALAGIGLGSLVKDATNQAMAVQGSTILIRRLLGDSAKDFETWANTQASAYGMSGAQALNFGSKFAVQVRAISSSTDDMSAKTQELLKMSAVIGSQSSYNMETIMDKIASGLRGETESVQDLGIQMEVNSLKMTNAFNKFANGQAWETLPSNIQQQIRYFGFMEQAVNLYGNSLGDTTQLKMMMFQAQLGNLKTALGNAFLPILDVVLPVLTRFAIGLQKAMNSFASFMRAVFGTKTKVKDANKTFEKQTKTTNTQSKSVAKLGDTFTKTGKKVKKSVDTMKSTLAGFDALNILSFATSGSDGSGGTGGGTGGDTGGGIDDGLNPPPDGGDPPDNETKWQEWAEKLKKWLGSLKPEWDNLKKGAENFWQGLVDIWNTPFIQDLKNNVLKGAMTLFKIAIDLVADSLEIIGDVFKIVADVLNGDWGKAWKDSKKLIEDVYDLFANFIGNFLDEDLEKKFKEGVESFKGFFGDIVEKIEEFAKDLFSGKVEEDLKKSFGKWWDSLLSIDVKKWFTDNVKPKIIGAFTGTSIGSTIWKNVTDYFNGGDEKKWFSDNVFTKIRDAFTGTGIGSKIWGNITSYFNAGDEKKWFADNVFTRVRDAFTGTSIGSKIWSNITSTFSKMGTKGVKQWFTDYVVSPIKSAFSGITSGLGGAITSGFKTIYNKAVGFINSMIDAVNKMVKKLNDLPAIGGIPTVPKIPKLATGGVVNKRTTAIIGENGSEVVMPLERNTGWIDMLASKISGSIGDSKGSGSGGDIVVQIGGTQLARITVNEINKLQRQSGKPILKL